jgi:hypothetical protein
MRVGPVSSNRSGNKAVIRYTPINETPLNERRFRSHLVTVDRTYQDFMISAKQLSPLGITAPYP